MRRSTMFLFILLTLPGFFLKAEEPCEIQTREIDEEPLQTTSSYENFSNNQLLNSEPDALPNGVTTFQTDTGRFDVVVEVENTDFASQHKYEREKSQKKNAPKKDTPSKRTSNQKDDEENTPKKKVGKIMFSDKEDEAEDEKEPRSYAPTAKMSIRWSSNGWQDPDDD